MMNKKIELGKNRDWTNIWFEQIKDNIYVLKSDKQYVINYGRCGIDENDDNAITFFDPSGGPMLYSNSSFRDVNNRSYFINKIYVDEFKRLCFDINNITDKKI